MAEYECKYDFWTDIFKYEHEYENYRKKKKKKSFIDIKAIQVSK